jgi:hypothetical protein
VENFLNPAIFMNLLCILANTLEECRDLGKIVVVAVIAGKGTGLEQQLSFVPREKGKAMRLDLLQCQITCLR